MFASIGRLIVARPWWVIAAWLIVGVAIAVSAPNLATVTTSDQTEFLPHDAESVQADALAAKEFPSARGATAIIVVTRADRGALTTNDVDAVRRLATDLGEHAPVALRGAVFDPSSMVSPNRLVAIVALQFDRAAEDSTTRVAVDEVRQLIRAELDGSDLRAGATGQAAIVADNKRALGHAELIVMSTTLALILLLLFATFRSPFAAVLPLLTVGVVFAVTKALIAIAAALFDFALAPELPTMLTVVLFGIGTDYILFLLFRYRERLRAGDAPADAIVTAVERVGEAICSAAFAVIAAFGALVLAALGFFATLGPALAVGTAVMLLAALTLVPALATVLGRYLFWPARFDRPRRRTNGFAWLGRFVARRAVAVSVSAALLLGGLTVGAFAFRPDFDPTDQLPDGMESTTAFADLQRGFPAGALSPVYVYLRADAPIDGSALTQYRRQLGATPGVLAVMPPIVSPDRRAVRVPLILRYPPYSAAALDAVSGPLKDQAHRAAPPGMTAAIGGQTMVFADVRAASQRDLSLIFPVAALLFVLILAGLLRAVLAPLYLVAMVVLGFAATLGATTWLFQDARGNPGLAFSIPIILYLFVTAIGTDYNILMTARIREELREGRSPRQAAALAVEHAGPSVAAAAAILAGTFGSLLLGGVPFFTEIGFAVTVGIVIVAFVVSIALVPAVTALAGRAGWWPGRLAPSNADQHEPDLVSTRP